MHLKILTLPVSLSCLGRTIVLGKHGIVPCTNRTTGSLYTSVPRVCGPNMDRNKQSILQPVTWLNFVIFWCHRDYYTNCYSLFGEAVFAAENGVAAVVAVVAVVGDAVSELLVADTAVHVKAAAANVH